MRRGRTPSVSVNSSMHAPTVLPGIPRMRTVMLRWAKMNTSIRPIQHPELSGADADAKASKMVADMFVSLRCALAHAFITQVWLM
eukprot:7590779-Pyramimonas_sp.AAC.1